MPAEAVTIELPEELARQAREPAGRTGRRVADILTDWLRLGALGDGSIFLVPDVDYPIYTPYGNEAIAQELLLALHADDGSAYSDETTR